MERGWDDHCYFGKLDTGTPVKIKLLSGVWFNKMRWEKSFGGYLLFYIIAQLNGMYDKCSDGSLFVEIVLREENNNNGKNLRYMLRIVVKERL